MFRWAYRFFVQKEKFKKAYQGFVFQAYIFIFLILSLYKFDIKRTEIFAQGLVLVLIVVYNLMHHKLKKKSGSPRASAVPDGPPEFPLDAAGDLGVGEIGRAHV